MQTSTIDPGSSPASRVFRVSELNREVRSLLEQGFPLLWVEGEISNLARPSSGHLYFTLKDDQAQVRCAMFRMRNRLLSFHPGDGVKALVRARVSLYEGRGEYQLIVEHMEETGQGALLQAYEALKQRLAAEGLFAEESKQALPTLPGRIGVITSPTGAAIRDILSILARRFPAIPVLIYPVPVQGAGAAEEIARTIRLASARGDCDVLILARGGGSLEDMWAFNEEAVARALFDCSLPVVTGIGHEIDFSIADFVADRRAPTPSAAAELLSPDREDWLRTLGQLRGRLTTQLQARLGERRQQFQELAGRLRRQHPGQRLQTQAQRMDELEQRLLNAQCNRLAQWRGAIATLGAQLQRHSPAHQIGQARTHCDHLGRQLEQAVKNRLETARQRLAVLVRALDAVSPLATLGRGYAIVTRLPEGMILRDAKQTAAGDQIQARLARGHLVCRVERTQEDKAS